MPDKPKNPFQFWEELKRRKVVRVITVYAAASFVILELVDIITEPFGLPDWTLKLVVVLLSIGLIVSIILYWIYDITPEGIEKTNPPKKVIEETVPPSSKGWKIASYISFVVIVVLILLNIIPRASRSEEEAILDKSIAVLPFINESSYEENTYFINGVMESVLNNLSKIKDLRVVSRNSVEQYRNNPKSTPMVAEEMNVSYVVEGSGQKLGGRILLTIQLIAGADDHHLWSKQYDREIKQVEDLLDIQIEISKQVAAEIKALITPEEKQRIEKVPTRSLTAYDFYQRAREEHLYYQIGYQTRQVLPNVEYLYHQALEYDTAFAEAYIGLAQVYWDKHYWDTYFTEDFLDSVIYLADVALSINDGLADAHTIKGEYYREKGLYDKALEEYNIAIDLNPNNWLAYFSKAQMYLFVDHIENIDNLQKAASLNRGQELPLILAWIANGYMLEGYSEKGDLYAQEYLILTKDSTLYNWMLGIHQQTMGNWDKATEYFETAYVQSSNPKPIYILISLGGNHTYVGNEEEALKIFREALDVLRTSGRINVDGMHRIGYAFWQNGFKDEADYYFDQQIEYCNMANALGRQYSKKFYSYYDLAGIYAFREDKEKAFENLRKYNQKQKITAWMANCIKIDPLFNSIRDEPEFQQIVSDVQAKYQAEHERVKAWLEENDML